MSIKQVAEKIHKALFKEEFSELTEALLSGNETVWKALISAEKEDKEKRSDPIESIVLDIVENEIEYAQSEWGDYYIQQHGVEEYMDIKRVVNLLKEQTPADILQITKRVMEVHNFHGESLMEHVINKLLVAVDDKTKEDLLNNETIQRLLW